MSSDRCGFTLDVEELYLGRPAVCCARPVWEDRDRCVWHARVDGKSAADLAPLALESGERIDGVYLRGATLPSTDWFAGRVLLDADFTDADVRGGDFSDAELPFATFDGTRAQNADFTDATLEGAVFTDADLRRATLADARINGAVFTDVHIGTGTTFGDRSIYEREGINPITDDLSHRLEAAAWSYRELRQIYEDNALPDLARRSYVREKDARRRLAWSVGDHLPAIKWELSRFVMGYGSSPYRILLVSLLLVVACALLFPVTGGIQEIRGERVITYTLDNPDQAPQWWLIRVFLKSFYFSLVTFATLGYGDIQPIGLWARMLAGVETILGSLLSALLVFVLARSVTW